MGRKAKKIEHVLVVRLSAMGDIAMTVPVVESLRAAHRDVRITVLTRPSLHAFYRGVSDINFVDYDASGRHRGIVGLLRLANEIRKAGVDAVADLQNSFKTRVLKFAFVFTKIKVATIESVAQDQESLTRRTRKVFSPVTPLVNLYQQTLYRLGLYFPMKRPPAQIASPMPAGISVEKKEGVWVGVAPFAKQKGKIYPIPLADKLINMLAEKYEKVFILGGGRYEKIFAEGMEQRHSGVVAGIAKVPLSAEMDIFSNLDVVVSMDTPSTHIASLVGVPVVSVWGATHPYSGLYGWGQSLEDTVQLPLPCRPCSACGEKACIFGDYRCLSDIEPELIVAAVEEHLAKKRFGADKVADVAPESEEGNGSAGQLGFEWVE